MKGSRNWLAFIGIEPGERRQVFLFLGFSFFLGVANNFSQTAAFTLFLSRYPAQTLSYVYILNAIIVTALTAIYMRLGRKLAFQKLLAANMVFLLALAGIFWAGLLLLRASWVVFLLPVLFQVIVNFGILAFWPLANRLFTVRQGKRLFGLIGSGQWIAIVVTGFLMGPFSSAIGIQNLLGLALVGLAGALVLVWFITHSYPKAMVNGGEQVAAAGVQVTVDRRRSPWRERYVLLIFSLVAIWWVGFFLIDNLFYDRAAVQYPDPSQLAGFLGIYLSILGILTLVMNFVLAGRIVSRFGIRTSLLLLPSILAGAALVLAVGKSTGGSVLLLFWMTIVAKLLDVTVGFSVDRSLQSLLYQPLPADQRVQIQTMAEGGVQPFGNGLAGLILLALGALFKVVTLPLILTLMAVALAWVMIANALGKEYPRKLLEAISKRRLDLSAVNLGDPSTILALRKGLSDPHPGPVIYAANCLEDVNREAVLQALPDLLRHNSPLVRQNTYERIERLKMKEILPQLRKALETETYPEAWRAGIRTLLSFGEAEDFAQIIRFMNHPIPQVRLGAIVGMLHSGRNEEMLMAGERLRELAHSDNADERIQATQAMAETGILKYAELQMALLQDPEVQVRQAALRTAGQLNSPIFWPSVITALADPQVRGEAARALVAGRSTALPQIRTVFEQIGQPPVVRRQLAIVCGQIKTQEALNLLRSKLEISDLETRAQVIKSLNRAGYQGKPEETAKLTGIIRQEAAFSTWLIASGIELSGSEPCRIVSAALQSELANGRERIFDLLACLGHRQNLSQVRRALGDPSPEQRAYALEIVDTQLPQELKLVLIPLLDDDKPEQRLKRLETHFPQRRMDIDERLEEIACRSLDWNTAWLAATALYTGARLRSAWLSHEVGRINEIENLILQDRQQWGTFRQNKQKMTGSSAPNGGEIMFSLIEKVLILKKSSLFSETPDDALAEAAQILQEENYTAGQPIIKKGSPGSSMYLIASGKVRVFDGSRTINYLEEGDVFGEMAVLDPAPRSASVEAVTDTCLLQMDQAQLYELVENRIEVARGIIQVLTRHLRNRMKDLDRLQNVQEQPLRA